MQDVHKENSGFCWLTREVPVRLEHRLFPLKYLMQYIAYIPITSTTFATRLLESLAFFVHASALIGIFQCTKGQASCLLRASNILKPYNGKFYGDAFVQELPIATTVSKVKGSGTYFPLVPQSHISHYTQLRSDISHLQDRCSCHHFPLATILTLNIFKTCGTLNIQNANKCGHCDASISNTFCRNESYL